MKKIKSSFAKIAILAMMSLFILFPFLVITFLICFSAGLLYLLGVEASSTLSLIVFIVIYLVVTFITGNLIELIASSTKDMLELPAFMESAIFTALNLPICVTVLGVLDAVFSSVACSMETAFVFAIILSMINIIFDMIAPSEAMA